MSDVSFAVKVECAFAVHTGHQYYIHFPLQRRILVTSMKASSPTTVIPDQPLIKEESTAKQNDAATGDSSVSIVREGVRKEITQQVLRRKLSKLRHLVVHQGINPSYLDSLFPQLLEHFDPQTVHYNGGIAQVKEWKISCYLEVMEGGIPCTNPSLKLLDLFQPLLDVCNDLFLEWYRQQHACNNKKGQGRVERTCKRIMTFVTRYTPAPGEQALLKVRERGLVILLEETTDVQVWESDTCIRFMNESQ
jgi:hypothetical protein